MGTVEDRIEAQREALGISRREIARRTGASQSNVNRWLTEGGAPASFLLACERAGLGRAAWLLTGEGSPDASETEAQEILEAVRELVAQRPVGQVRSLAADPEVSLDVVDESEAGRRPGTGSHPGGSA